MAFWSEATLDPKRQYKFKVTFGYLNVNGNESTFLAQYADRPVYAISDGTKVHYLDKEFAFPGKITWTPIKIRFVDAVGPQTVNVSQRTYTYLANAGYLNPEQSGPLTTPAEMKTISKSKAVNSVLNVTVEVLNSEGSPVDKWTLRNAFVQTVSLNPLDYSAEGILTAEYTFRYDWAEYIGV